MRALNTHFWFLWTWRRPLTQSSVVPDLEIFQRHTVSQVRLGGDLLFNLVEDGSRNAAVYHQGVTDQLSPDDLVLAAEPPSLNAVSDWGFRFRFIFGAGPTKSAVLVFWARHRAPECHVHLRGTRLPVVLSYKHLGAPAPSTSSTWSAEATASSHSACSACRGAALSICQPTWHPRSSRWAPSCSLSPRLLCASWTKHSRDGEAIFWDGLQVPLEQVSCANVDGLMLDTWLWVDCCRSWDAPLPCPRVLQALPAHHAVAVCSHLGIPLLLLSSHSSLGSF